MIQHRLQVSLVLVWIFGALSLGLGNRVTAGEPPRAEEAGNGTPAPDRDGRLRERDRLSGEASRLRKEGKPREAIAAAEGMLAIEREVLGSVHEDVSGSLEKLAILHEELDDFSAAVRRRQEVFEISKKLHGERNWRTTDARLDLEDSRRLWRMKPEEREAIREAYRVEKDANRAEGRGEYQEALPLAEKVLELRARVLGKRDRMYAAAAALAASIHWSLGDFVRARPLYEESSAIVKEALGEEHPWYASSLSNLALLHSDMGDQDQAESLLKQSLDLETKVLGKDAPDLAGTLNNLAGVYEKMKDYGRAEPLFLRALEIKRKTLGEESPSYANALQNLGELYRRMDDLGRAEETFKKALEITRKALGDQHPQYAASLQNLTAVLTAKGEYGKAESLQREALEIARARLGETHPNCALGLNNLAALLFLGGEYQHAAPLLLQALEMYRQILEVSSPAQSERGQIQFLESARISLDAYLSLAPLAGLSGDQAYREVLAWKGAVFSRQRRARALAAQPDLAPLLVELRETAVRIQAAIFSGPAVEGRERWSAMVNELTKRKEEIERRLSEANAEYRRGREAARTTPHEVQAALPRDAVLVDLLVYLHQHRRAAPGNNETGRAPAGRFGFENEARLAAFVVRPAASVEQLDLGPMRAIERAIFAWREGLAMERTIPLAGAAGADEETAALLKSLREDPLTPEQASAELRRRLLEPIAERLEGARLLLVSPDGNLGNLPWGALPGRKPGSHLIEELAVALVPFAQELPGMLGRPASGLPPSLLLVGDVDYGAAPAGAEFRPLPQSGAEIRSITGTFKAAMPGLACLELSGQAATVAAFAEAAPRHRFLHLATHGFYASPEVRAAMRRRDSEEGGDKIHDAGAASKPMAWHPGLLSGIALAGANAGAAKSGEDGILTAPQLEALPLEEAELVVFSACESGLGTIMSGESLLGIQRSVHLAGARSVVASLWKVDDEDARAFMVSFYDNLWRRRLPKVEALREAQLAFLRGGLTPASLASRGPGAPKPLRTTEAGRVSPRAWAAWTLSGDWR